jgi:DNA-binding MarR family transcriptional regulator
MTKANTRLRAVKRSTGSATEAQRLTITDLLAYRLHEVANLVSRGAAMRYKREFGVTLWEWRTIALLGAKQVLSLNELAKAGGLDKSQISRVVTGLTRRRLVLRQIDDKDGRGIRLSLTAAGQRLYEGLIHASGERNAAFLDCMTQEERRALDSVLTKVERQARDFIEQEKQLANDA